MMLTKAELVEHKYPEDTLEGFVQLEQESSGSLEDKTAPLFALDCEMVRPLSLQPLHFIGPIQHIIFWLIRLQSLSDAGPELVRATIVDEGGQVLFDSLVKPARAIRDYKTE